ncbi:MAG: SH3 domain-containing protein [Chloroflexi bacterium]|nr:SH3 domain-containing protein [Chloroflexota bacterium]
MRFWMITLCLALFIFTTTPVTGQENSTPRSITAEDALNLRVLTLLAHHTAPITETSFSPNSTAFLTGSIDGTLCIWNVGVDHRQTPGVLRFCLKGYTPGVTLFAWSPDDVQLAVTLGDGLQIALYDITSVVAPDNWEGIAPSFTLPSNETPYLSLDFVAGGKQLLAHDLFDTLTLFSLDSNRDNSRLATLEGSEGVVNSDTSRAAIVDFDGNAVLLNTANGQEIATLETDGANHALFSPGGRWLVTWGGLTVQIWDTSHPRIPAPRQIEAQADNLQFTPNGRFLATWEGQDIRLWNIETGEITGTMPEHRGGIRLLVFGADSTRAISINTQGYARYWEISDTGVPSLKFWFEGEIDNVLLGPDSRTLITLRQDIEARFWDFARGQVRGRYELSDAPLFSPDWTLVAISSGNLVVWQGLKDDPRTFDWTPLGFTTAVTNIRPTPSQDQQRLGVLAANTPVFAIARTEDGTWIQIQLPDDTTGWIQPSALQINGKIGDLPISRH